MNSQTPLQPPRTRLDWAIAASILLMLAMNLVVFFGDIGPSAAYAAVPM
jgi:hypothetical protein